MKLRFEPFYASYVIAELDEEYQYALVTGSDTDYLWLLERTYLVKSLL
jgi:apolipoprotein D and lipocalin family protein